KDPGTKRIYLDGDARTAVQAALPAVPPPIDDEGRSIFPYRPAYLVKPDPASVLVIGIGGGIDIWAALQAGARRIDAVELNRTTERIGRREYRPVNNDLFIRPGVATYNEDGRSFVRANRSRYDAIVIHAIDTFAAINAGAYVLSENYLYSVEAF